MTPAGCAILLCAGYGTRMAALGEKRAKPLLEVAGRPMLDYLIGGLAGLPGIETFEVITNARFAEDYRAWAAAHPERARIRVHDDGTRHADERLGAVGDLGWLLERIGLPEHAMVAAGDNIFLFDLAPLWTALCRRGRSQVLALREDDPTVLRRTGVLELDEKNRVLELAEKPAEPRSSWACPSIYALTGADLARVLPYLAASGARDEIGRFIAALVRESVVEAVPTTGRRLHVGDPEELARASAELKQLWWSGPKAGVRNAAASPADI